MNFLFSLLYTWLLIVLIIQATLAISIRGPLLTTLNRSNFNNNKLSTTNKVVLITGANTGIGKELAFYFFKAGYRVVLACRDQNKANKVINELSNNNSMHNQSNMQFIELNLSDLSSVIRFVKQFKQQYSRIDILINNAGLNEPGLLSNGYQQLFYVNYLGHYLLTRLLIHEYKHQLSKNPLRVVNLSSVRHHAGKTDFERSAVDSSKRCNSYADSKLYMNLLTYEINKRYSNICSIKCDKPYSPIFAVSANPGAVNSDIWRGWKGMRRVALNCVLWAFLTPEQGAQTSIMGALLSEQDIIDNSMLYSTTTTTPARTATGEQATGTGSSANRSGNRYFYGDKLIPYLVPYHIPLPLILFEKIGPFAGPRFSRSTVPYSIDQVSSELWEYSSKLCREIVPETKVKLTL